MREVGARTSRGTYIGRSEADACLPALQRQGLVTRTDAGWQCTEAHRARLYRDAIRGPDFAKWRDALVRTDGIHQVAGRFGA